MVIADLLIRGDYYDFFQQKKKSPKKLLPAWGAPPPPPLKNEALHTPPTPLSEKQIPPLKSEAVFQ